MATPTNGTGGTATASGHQSMIERGTALAQALARAEDVPAGPAFNLPGYAPGACAQGPTEADWVEAAQVADEAAAQRFLDSGDRLTLDELIERQIEFYEGWQNEAGTMFALHMTELLIKYRGAGIAATPAEAMDRIEILEQDVRQDWEARGYDAGFDAGCRQAMPYNGPLD
jgi:hypothetical protein